jgi:hypothetical protein
MTPIYSYFFYYTTTLGLITREVRGRNDNAQSVIVFLQQISSRIFVLIVLIGLGFREASGAGKHTAYSTTLPYTQANTVTNQRRHKSHANVYYLYKRPLE